MIFLVIDNNRLMNEADFIFIARLRGIYAFYEVIKLFVFKKKLMILTLLNFKHPY